LAKNPRVVRSEHAPGETRHRRAAHRSAERPRSESADRKPSPGRRPDWATFGAVAAIALIAIASYANTLGAGLVLDDVPAIVENRYVHDGRLAALFTEPSWWGPQTSSRYWRPLTTASFALNFAAHGVAPFGYHLVNVALHATVSLLVFALVARLATWLVAVAAALLFAVHPIHTEAVASVVGRAELLAASGFLLAWLAFLASDRLQSAARWTPRRVALETAGGACFFAALLAKENAIALPAVLALHDVLRRRSDGRPTLREHWPRYAVLGAIALLFVALRARITGQLALAVPPLDNPLVTLSAFERALTTIAVIGMYAWRLIVAWPLSTDYSAWQIPAVATPLAPTFLLGLAALVGVPVAAWQCRTRAPAVTLGLVILALTFAPVSNVPFLIGTIMAERLLYLPSIGFCLVVGAAFAYGVADERGVRTVPILRALALGLLLLVASARTWTRNEVWHDDDALTLAMAHDAPRSSRARTALGDLLVRRGRLDDAFQQFQEALTIEPRNWNAQLKRGNDYLSRGELDAAATAYQRTLELEPRYAKAMINLAAAESRRGATQTAIDWLRRAIAIEPEAVSAHTSLANVLASSGDVEGARAEFQRALALAPNAPNVLADYGAFLGRLGDHANAIATLQRALAVAPPTAERQYNLGNELIAIGDLERAAAAYRSAVALKPDFTSALENLGNTESLRGDHRAALEWLERARDAGAASARLFMNIANELVHAGRMADARANYEKALAMGPPSESLRANYAKFLAMQQQ
jgi:Flp pilus assembly protein TadD